MIIVPMPITLCHLNFNFSVFQNMLVCRFLHFFIFAVNYSNLIRKTIPVVVATINVQNRNSVKICAIAFSCIYQNAEIITDAKLVLSSIVRYGLSESWCVL